MKFTFDFEKPLIDLQAQIEKVKQVEEKTQVDMSATLTELDDKLEIAKKEVYTNLTGWQKVQISRHPERAIVAEREDHEPKPELTCSHS